MNAIELQRVHKSFRSPDGLVEAVAGIDVTIKPGEIVAFLGPNGAGKTTTLDMLLGLTSPTSGTIEVFGLAPRSAIMQGKIGAVLQTGGLLRDLRVGETIRAIAALQGATSQVGKVMALTGLADVARRQVSRCWPC